MMDAKTQQMIVTVGGGIAKKVLMLQAAGLVSHGVMSANYTEIYVSLGMATIGAGWSFWNDYGKAIVLSQLEVFKAKSLAQAEKMRNAGIPAVTMQQIANQSSKMNPTDVAQVVATMPAEVKANIAPIVAKLVVAAVAMSFLLASAPAMAQTKLPHLQITGNPVADTKANFGLTGNASADAQALWQKIVGSSLNDLNYAAAMAKNAGTLQATTRLQCINAIIALNKQASGIDLKDDAGNPLSKPDPHVFTEVETLAEIVDNLAPTGPLFVSCAGAAQLAKTNVLSFVNAVVTGAAGFAAMPIIPGL